MSPGDLRNNFSSTDVRQFWDGVAGIYDRANDNVRVVHDQRYRESLRYFSRSKPRVVLNVWSRTGEAVEFLRQQGVGAMLVNLEVSMPLIRRAVARGRGKHSVQTDLTDLPVRSDSVDLVLSLETLEHCPDPFRFLTEVYRVLRPGGTLVLSCPPAFAEFVLRIYEFFAFNHGEGPHRFPPSREVKRLLARTGFDLLDHRGTLFVPFESLQWLDAIVERPLNAIGLSDLGIRQFFYARKQVVSHD